MLGLGTPIVYKLHAKKTYLMLEHQDEQRLLTVDMVCLKEANKTEKQTAKNLKVPTVALQMTTKTSWIYD